MRYVRLIPVLLVFLFVTACAPHRQVIAPAQQTCDVHESRKVSLEPELDAPLQVRTTRSVIREEVQSVLIDFTLNFLERLLIAYLDKELGNGAQKVAWRQALSEAGVITVVPRLNDRRFPLRGRE